MDYNRLKLVILQALSDAGPTDSEALAKRLEPTGILVEIHALRMALMRYYKLGLLKRERQGGVLVYSLSERGTERLRWLQETKDNTVAPGTRSNHSV